MCTRVNSEDLLIIHHELGHIQYYMQYKDNPVVYRDGANPGFHEAIGDTIALSVGTPKHLAKIGLLKDHKPDEESRINQLYYKALAKVILLPFAFNLDQYRWGIFRGEIKPNEYNCRFWKLRHEYSGIRPPVERSEKDFDAPAKYHISADVEYLRYVYLTNIILQSILWLIWEKKNYTDTPWHISFSSNYLKVYALKQVNMIPTIQRKFYPNAISIKMQLLEIHSSKHQLKIFFFWR